MWNNKRHLSISNSVKIKSLNIFDYTVYKLMVSSQEGLGRDKMEIQWERSSFYTR